MKEAEHQGQLKDAHFVGSFESNNWSGKPNGRDWGEVVMHSLRVYQKD
jgi:hypothetical protein